MKTRIRLIAELKDERGVVLIIISIMMVIFIGLAAFAIDIGHIAVVRNELRNAADAGALAGARFLYTEDGTSVNPGVNQIAYDAAVANTGEGTPVEVLSVERGHWSFTLETFWPNEDVSTLPELVDNTTFLARPFDDLDTDPNFINAVRVRTGRIDTPASSFFSKIFGYNSFALQAEAVAYIGFAGTIMPGELDQPIGICAQSIMNQDDLFRCNIGRMLNATSSTAGWTDFEQPCSGAASTNIVTSLICSGGNPQPIRYGEHMSTTGGVQASTLNKLIECWNNETNKESPWELRLAVIDCPGNNVSNCSQVVGAVTVHILWITEPGVGNLDSPRNMEGINDISAWSSNEDDVFTRWNSFVTHFNLEDVEGSPAPLLEKSIYFLPSCEPHTVQSTSGGENFGVLATIPVLVK
jgi:hypothetical protein